jgi:arylsulfatase A-like enzyme/Flp pilus assembly protein TadD
MRFRLLWSATALGLAVRCGGPTGSLPGRLDPRDLNVVLVTLDTTRADRFGCYGSTQQLTPQIDRLAAEGTLFLNASSATPLTLPAHSSLMTARLPAAHGVRDNGGFKLASDQTTLAEVLKANGWVTGGFVSAYVLDRKWGIAQGFEHYRDQFEAIGTKSADIGEIQRSGDDTVAAALNWIDQQQGNRFFSWIHLYDPHTPYAPPEPYRSRHADPYDGEIAWTDDVVGRLLGGLEQRRLTDRSVIVVLADHGESLGEHGEHGHGLFIYRQTTHIPLILKAPHRGLQGVRVAATARMVDVAPTILDLVGLAGQLDGQGLSLMPLITGETGGDPRAGYAESFYPRFHYGWSELRSVQRGSWRLIEAPRPELYDLAADPGERNNLALHHPDQLEELRASLAEIDRETPVIAAAAPIEEDEETLARLASLGYVGTAQAASDQSFRELPDPKDKIDVYNAMGRAREWLKRGDQARGRDELSAVLERDPKLIDAWYLIGNSYLKERQWEQAAEYFKKTLELRPDHDYAVIGLADTLVMRGRVDDAVLGYERFLQTDPNNGQITYRLAQVLLDAGRHRDADRWFGRTLELEPVTARAEVGRAVVLFRERDLVGARAALTRALAIDPKAKHARFNWAVIEETEGKLREAEASYRQALLEHPDDYKAAFNLGRLLGRRGDLQGAVEMMQRSTEISAQFGTGRFFLASVMLQVGRLDEAERWARAGLAIEPDGRFSALGEYVLADVFSRRGDARASAAAAARGRRLEARAGERTDPRFEELLQ